MSQPQPLRPELASVCSYLGPTRTGVAVPASARLPCQGVLADLAAIRGRP